MPLGESRKSQQTTGQVPGTPRILKPTDRGSSNRDAARWSVRQQGHARRSKAPQHPLSFYSALPHVSTSRHPRRGATDHSVSANGGKDMSVVSGVRPALCCAVENER